MPTRVLPNADFDLAAYRWENRILLIFGPAAHDDRFEEQVDLFAAQAEGIIDRDLLIVHVLGDDLGETARSLRERYAVARDAFAVLLIGKDGGLKHRFAAPVTAAEIFGLIDVMPMRMREMQEDGE